MLFLTTFATGLNNQFFHYVTPLIHTTFVICRPFCYTSTASTKLFSVTRKVKAGAQSGRTRARPEHSGGPNVPVNVKLLSCLSNILILLQITTCATYSLNWLVFITEMKSVSCTVRTGSLNKAFCIYLRTNSDLCHLHHKLVGSYNRDEKCLLRGTNWVFK